MAGLRAAARTRRGQARRATLTALATVGALLAAACGERPAPPAAAPAPASAAVAAAAPVPPPAASAAVADAAVAPAGQADRLAPPVVPPVERDGVRYTQAESGRDVGLDQVGGVLVATEIASGKRLWVLAVYPNPVDPAKEADAQWIFFKSMAFGADGRLRIVNEADAGFSVDLATRSVTRLR